MFRRRRRVCMSQSEIERERFARKHDRKYTRDGTSRLLVEIESRWRTVMERVLCTPKAANRCEFVICMRLIYFLSPSLSLSLLRCLSSSRSFVGLLFSPCALLDLSGQQFGTANSENIQRCKITSRVCWAHSRVNAALASLRTRIRFLLRNFACN